MILIKAWTKFQALSTVFKVLGYFVSRPFHKQNLTISRSCNIHFSLLQTCNSNSFDRFFQFSRFVKSFSLYYLTRLSKQPLIWKLFYPLPTLIFFARKLFVLRYVALFVVSGSLEKLCSIDYVNIYLFKIFSSIESAWQKSVGLPYIAYIVIH